MRLVCCHGARTPDTKYDREVQCSGCDSTWHYGCVEHFLSNQDLLCCPGSTMRFTKHVIPKKHRWPAQDALTDTTATMGVVTLVGLVAVFFIAAIGLGNILGSY